MWLKSPYEMKSEFVFCCETIFIKLFGLCMCVSACVCEGEGPGTMKEMKAIKVLIEQYSLDSLPKITNSVSIRRISNISCYYNKNDVEHYVGSV